jgi:hypothetical protein
MIYHLNYWICKTFKYLLSFSLRILNLPCPVDKTNTYFFFSTATDYKLKKQSRFFFRTVFFALQTVAIDTQCFCYLVFLFSSRKVCFRRREKGKKRWELLQRPPSLLLFYCFYSSLLLLLL